LRKLREEIWGHECECCNGCDGCCECHETEENGVYIKTNHKVYDIEPNQAVFMKVSADSGIDLRDIIGGIAP
jgi:hypothetical protein